MKSDWEKGRAAVDILTRDLKLHQERQGNYKYTETEARKEAEKIANRAEQKIEIKRK